MLRHRQLSAIYDIQSQVQLYQAYLPLWSKYDTWYLARVLLVLYQVQNLSTV